MTRGGHRQGAGRKKGFAALQAEQARELFARTLAPHMESVINALIKSAKGGNIQAARELFDRSWGKPISSVELEKIQVPPIKLVFDSAFDTTNK